MADFFKDKGRPSGRRSQCKSCSVQMNRDWRAKPGNRERHSANNKRRWLALKMEGLRHYGGVCACCGEADVRFLTFDHIDGGGRKHFEETGPTLAHWLRKNSYPEGFQVLCWNCNGGRSVNGGICPHADPDGLVIC